MIEIKYTDRPMIAPKVVYCDTGFLYQLYLAADTVRLNLQPPHSKRLAWSARQFAEWARKQRATFVTSNIALEELLHVLMFVPIVEEVKRRGLTNWKDLRARDPAAFLSLITRARRVAVAFHAFWTSSQISLIGGTRTLGRDVAAFPQRVYLYARLLLCARELDTADAFQIAVARYYRVDWAATTDRDWFNSGRLNVVLP